MSERVGWQRSSVRVYMQTVHAETTVTAGAAPTLIGSLSYQPFADESQGVSAELSIRTGGSSYCQGTATSAHGQGFVDPAGKRDWIAQFQEDSLKFQQLASDWYRQRGASSSLTQGAVCPAYQQIIGMGERALPLILLQLQREGDDPDQWFWALQVITGEQPAEEEDRGNFLSMARAWLEWGKTNGYVR